MELTKVAGIYYSKPIVSLLQETGIGTSEVAARTCYDSFSKSEHDSIKLLGIQGVTGNTSDITDSSKDYINKISHSELLDTLAWTHFHHSVLEHSSLTYIVKNTSRGVLQEHARHRIQSLSVRSTRYTMQNVLYAFVATNNLIDFAEIIESLDMFIVRGPALEIEIEALYTKLVFPRSLYTEEAFLGMCLSKQALELYKSGTIVGKSYVHIGSAWDLYERLKTCQSKRNVGDSFKWVVTDNWSVDLVFTMNIRSLKNYLKLRDSAAAFFQIRWLAEAVVSATPKKYLDLIIKG